jgi:hypothetical protein
MSDVTVLMSEAVRLAARVADLEAALRPLAAIVPFTARMSDDRPISISFGPHSPMASRSPYDTGECYPTVMIVGDVRRAASLLGLPEVR